jgi:hypothetical protein
MIRVAVVHRDGISCPSPCECIDEHRELSLFGGILVGFLSCTEAIPVARTRTCASSAVLRFLEG